MKSIYVFLPVLGDSELRFWEMLADVFWSSSKIILAISGYGVTQASWQEGKPAYLPLTYTKLSCPDLLENLKACLPTDQLQERAALWTEAYPLSSIYCHATTISHHLKVLAPLAVLIWNWHRPEGMLVRSIASQLDIDCWDIERTPWPGMLTIDRYGQLSETSLARDLAVFISQYDSGDHTSTSKLKELRGLADQYFARIKAKSYTWWNQPKSSDHLVQHIVNSNAYRISNHRILFAGQVDRDVQNFLFSPFYSSSLDAFHDFLCALPEGSFLLGKHHPMSNTPVEDFRNLLAEMPHIDGIWTDELSLDVSLDLVDYVSAVNSSLLFEALSAGKSCFEMGQTMLSGLNIIYDRGSSPHLKDPVKTWLSASLDDVATRVERFRLCTGFALSAGLLSFTDLDESTPAPTEPMQFVVRWLKASGIDVTAGSSPISSVRYPFGNLSDELALRNLVENIVNQQELSIQASRPDPFADKIYSVRFISRRFLSLILSRSVSAIKGVFTKLFMNSQNPTP